MACGIFLALIYYCTLFVNYYYYYDYEFFFAFQTPVKNKSVQFEWVGCLIFFSLFFHSFNCWCWLFNVFLHRSIDQIIHFRYSNVTMYFDFNETDRGLLRTEALSVQVQKSNANFYVTAPSLIATFFFDTRHFLSLSLYYRPHFVQYLINKMCIRFFLLLYWMSMSVFRFD